MAFPRLIGTKGEKRAIEIIIDEFKKAGYKDIHREKFKTSFYVWIFTRYAFFVLSTLLIFLGIAFFFSDIIAIVLASIFIISLFLVLKITSSTDIKLMKDDKKNYETENIYTELKSKNSKAKVILMGHYDSKSQVISVYTRVLTITIVVLGGFILSLTYLIIGIVQLFSSLESQLLNISLLCIAIFLAINGYLNFFNKTGNLSPGAYDNAAAVGFIIEMARFLREKPLENLDFIFLCTSSEELNLGGAKDFLRRHRKEFDQNYTYFINYDPVGGNELIRVITSFGIPRKRSSEKLNKLFLKSAEKLDIKAEDYYLAVGGGSDYMPIVQEGFEACWISTTPGYKQVHTKKDDMSLVTIEGIKNVLYLTVDALNQLNTDYS